MTRSTGHTQLVIIGAGPGGYGAAFMAADLGLDVVLIGPDPDPGGVCLYRGCIPSKALLHVARVIGDAKGASKFGVHFDGPKIDVAKLRKWKDDVVSSLTRGLGYLSDQRKIRHIRGTARFVDPFEVEIEDDDGDKRRLGFENAIIATGSYALDLPGLSFDHPKIISSTEALELEEIPQRLLIVGGGYIGLEMATVYNALGSEVTLVEATPDLLPGVDRELVEPLAKSLKRGLHRILLQCKVVETSDHAEGIEVLISGEGLEEEKAVFDKILVAVGRRPNSEDLGLERTRVEVGQDGFIAVDEERRTTDRHIFAIGDVVEEPMLAHKATHEGIVAARIIAGQNDVFDPRAIPAVVFTDPEIAWCGLTEEEAKAQKRDIKIGRFPWLASGRAKTMGRRQGITKIIADAKTNLVLGVGICGVDAGEIIAEAALCLEMGGRAQDLAATIHPHPTLSETLMEAAEDILGKSTHFIDD